MVICCMAQETQTGTLYQPRGGMGREIGGRFKMEGIHVHLWLTHFEFSQKITKFCKSIILQLKNKLKKKNDKGYGKMTNLMIQVEKEIKATLL